MNCLPAGATKPHSGSLKTPATRVVVWLSMEPVPPLASKLTTTSPSLGPQSALRVKLSLKSVYWVPGCRRVPEVSLELLASQPMNSRSSVTGLNSQAGTVKTPDTRVVYWSAMVPMPPLASKLTTISPCVSFCAASSVVSSCWGATCLAPQVA